MRKTAIKTALGLALGGALLASPAQAMGVVANHTGLSAQMTANHHDNRWQDPRAAYRYDDRYGRQQQGWDTRNRDYDHDDRWDYRRDVDQHRYDDRRYDDRRYDDRDFVYDHRGQRIYRERSGHRDQRVYQQDFNPRVCRQTDGGTGTIIGGAIGALLGREIDKRGDRTLGTVLGAAGGALIGRELEKGRCR